MLKFTSCHYFPLTNGQTDALEISSIAYESEVKLVSTLLLHIAVLM